ncbi:MAG: aldehyde ferredoxin oxidoreductase C-terminal domain-containing protein [Gemmatales bacterium]|nr:hypothetical protein [Gemmatales bacterium]MDW7993271.1 aldehyde ferredoxin oxidoreductase C-terminal domain-containing protein [Gemmatales bacterium]
MYGYHGRYLRVDLTQKATEAIPLPEKVLRHYLGGVGLGTWLLLQHWPDNFPEDEWHLGNYCPPHSTRRWPSTQFALHPRAPFVCAFSPLIGSPLTTSARCALVACSPLTGRLNDALCGSQWALTGKRTGFDALVFQGACAEPTVVLLDEDRLELLPAQRWWGLSEPETEAALQAELGSDWAFLVIGPAGEHLVRFATGSHARRHAGRGGLGAVLGAKRVKAIGVRGQRRVRFAQPQALAEYARRLSQISLGPATAKYRELGTVANLEVFARLGVLPQRNFDIGITAAPSSPSQSTTVELAPLLERLARTHLPVRQGCVACTIGCEHLYQSDEPVRLEYESLFALGPMCGVHDAEAVLHAAQLCDELGLDTISTGGTLAWAMACVEHGLLDAELHFGDAHAVTTWIRRIAYREGLGDLLAEGSRLAAAEINPAAERLALHVKGLELPGYDIRRLPHLALGLAVNARGADHNRSSAYDADFAPRSPDSDSPRAWAAQVVACEDRAALLDSLILCKFLRHALSDWYAESAIMLQLITGWDITPDELRATARRIIDAKKRFNLHVGWTCAEDILPEALWQQQLTNATCGPTRSGVFSSTIIDRTRFFQARQEYYRLRGWDELGRTHPGS